MIQYINLMIPLDTIERLNVAAIDKRNLAGGPNRFATVQAARNGSRELAMLADTFALNLTVEAQAIEDLVAELTGQSYIAFCRSQRRQSIWGG